jgi:hypothetical protein
MFQVEAFWFKTPRIIVVGYQTSGTSAFYYNTSRRQNPKDLDLFQPNAKRI